MVKSKTKCRLKEQSNHQKQFHMGQDAGIMKITVINKMRMIIWKVVNIQEEVSNLMGIESKKRIKMKC